jgi:lysozyme
MKTSLDGRKAIQGREGNILTAYRDTVGVLTIGTGHTSAAGAPAVTQGMKITPAQSDDILARDLAAVEAQVNAAVKVPLTQNQFDALVSFVFNIGGGAFRGSTLLRKLNSQDYKGAAEQFLVWIKQPELLGRRKQERAQFLTP